MTRILVFGMNQNPGGMESFIMNYYRRINREKIQFDFLTNCPSIAYEQEIAALGGHVFKITPRSQNYPLYRRQLTAFFETHAADYDGVWMNTCSLANIDYLKMAKKYGIPRRIIHSHNAQNMDSRLRGVLHTLNKGAVTRYATDFWACSRQAGAFFYGDAIRNSPRYQEIPNAIDPTPFLFDSAVRASVRKQMAVEDTLVIGHVGRLHFQKNQAFLLDVFKDIRTHRPHSRLWLVGQGQDEPTLRRKAAELGLTDAVDFLGVREDIPRLLQGMDVFVFPSRFEGLGIALVEAQAAGLPCVTSTAVPRDAAVTDLVTFLPLSDSPALWAQAALQAAGTPRTDRRAEIAAAGYDIHTQVTHLEALLEERV